jgi:hypothetical protein
MGGEGGSLEREENPGEARGSEKIREKDEIYKYII